MISVGFIVVTILALFKYVLPNRDTAALGKEMTSRSEFSSAYFKIYLIVIVTTVVATFSFNKILNSLYSKPTDGYVFNLLPGEDYWMFGALTTGFFLGLTVLFVVVKVLFGDRSANFWAHYDSMYNFKAKSVLTVAWLSIGITAIAITLIGQNTYFLIGQNDIKIREPLELNERTYSYADVKELNLKNLFTAPNGERKNVEHYEIVFNDGYVWKSKSALREPQQNDIEFINYISRQSLKLVNR